VPNYRKSPPNRRAFLLFKNAYVFKK